MNTPDPDTSPGQSQKTRWELLLGILADRERLSVTDAASELAVSESTIRRDFDLMAQRQLAKRTHGGIVATSVAYGLPQRYAKASPAITRIGVAASELILERYPTNPTIGINGGTTTTAVATELGKASDSIDSTDTSDVRLTVASSALNIAMELVLRHRIRLVSLGGVVRRQSYELTGPLAIASLNSLWMDCMVLGVEGIEGLAGATCSDPDEAAVTSAMVEHSGTVIAVAEAQKIGQRSFSRICTLRQIDVLVTDKSISEEQLAMLHGHKVEVNAV